MRPHLKNPIGIMQGRLSPPVDGRFQCFPLLHWQDEFGRAAEAGFQFIEWIFDEPCATTNPVASDSGIELLRQRSKASGVAVRSMCADYFMERPLLRVSPAENAQRLEKLSWLLGRCQQVGIQRVVLPFVDASRIDDDKDFNDVVASLRSIAPRCEATGVEIHLETSLPPKRFAELLAAVDHPKVKVNYDSGNSASLGFDVGEEFAAYGARVGSVHIKDRVRGGGTVPLGKGNADFTAFRDCLRRIGYTGDLTLQVARGEPGQETAMMTDVRHWVEQWLNT
jgi:L-ribulose-5-phosphate 3-epimerase